MKAHGLFIRIKAHSQFASAAERNVLEYVQKHPQDVVGRSARSLAEVTFTSPSTVIRLSRKLGCDGIAYVSADSG